MATAQKYADQLANAQRFAPELAVLESHTLLFARLAAYPDPANAPARLVSQAIAAAGGGTRGVDLLDVISANGPAIEGVISVQLQLDTLKPYAAQLTALSRVPAPVQAYLSAYGPSVQRASADTAGQWRNWFWVCFAGIVFFVLCIPLLRGRWRPRSARRDAAEHEAMVAAELARLGPAASG